MTHPVDRLLADILNAQADDAPEDRLVAIEPRLRDYARGAAWARDDANLVWTSPSARASFLSARALARAEARAAWRSRGLPTVLVQRAAEGADDQSRVIEEAGVTIRILRSPGLGDWIISVELSAEAAQVLSPGVKLCLRDTGGRIWLEGAPDAAGGLDNFWDDASESPLNRLGAHSLMIDFS